MSEQEVIKSSVKGKLSSQQREELTFKDALLKIRELLIYVLSKWFIIMFVGFFGAVVGFCYAYFNKPVYTATCTFVLEDNSNGTGALGQYAGLASMVGIDLGGSGGGIFQGENIMELYKSRRMIESALLKKVKYQGREQLLVDRYLDFNEVRKQWVQGNNNALKKTSFDLKAGNGFNRLQDSVLGRIVEDINSHYLSVNRPDKKLSIIKVDVKSKDEFFAKEFADRITETVNEFYIRTKAKKAYENLAILQHQTDSVKDVMNGAIYKTAAFADATPNLNPMRQVLRASAQRTQFNAEANKAILTQLVQNLELAKITLRKETPLIQIIDTPIYPLKKDKVGKLMSMVTGGILAVFLSVLILTVKELFKNLMN